MQWTIEPSPTVEDTVVLKTVPFTDFGRFSFFSLQQDWTIIRCMFSYSRYLDEWNIEFDIFDLSIDEFIPTLERRYGIPYGVLADILDRLINNAVPPK